MRPTKGLHYRVFDFRPVGRISIPPLRRRPSDIQKLAELHPNVRLCIGIYREPAEIAMQDKDEMKRHMLELLEVMWRNHQHVGLATHEEWCVRDALRLAVSARAQDADASSARRASPIRSRTASKSMTSSMTSAPVGQWPMQSPKPSQ